jgi:acetolactate synthase-1/3 small subunit
MTRHTLSVLVENRPSVLARVAGLFARRGFNIDSLAVGPTENPELSRMTVVVDVADLPLEQVTKQLNKLINVIKVVELEDDSSVNRELVMIKVKAGTGTRAQVLEIVDLFRAKVVDVVPDAVVVEATGTTDKIEALLRMLEPHGVKELVQSGVVALSRGPKSMHERTYRS